MANWTFIYNETLTGTVDWINKVFTTLNDIDKLEEVYLGWAAYRDVTYTGNVITFTDAPPVGAWQPTADYFLAPVPSSAPSDDVTWGELKTEAYDILGSDSTSPVFTLAIIERYLNKGLQKIKNEKFFKEKVLQYTFNKAKDTNAIGYDANTITVTDANYIPANWALLLTDAAFVEYSTYTSWVFGAQAGYTYKSWDRVLIGYKLPAWVKKPSEVIVRSQPLSYVDNREFVIGCPDVYTIIHSSDWSRYLFLPYSDEAPVTVKYITEHTIYTTDAEVVDILYEYTDAIALYAAYKACIFREDDRWQAFKQEFIEEKNRLKAYKARQTDWINNKIRTRPLVQTRRVSRPVRFEANITTTP